MKLVSRHRLGLALTREGYQFLHYARNILTAVSDAKSLARSANTNLNGTVRLGVPPTVMGYYLPGPLTRFRRLYPNVKLEIVELDMIEIDRALREARIELAVCLLSWLDASAGIETLTMFSSRRRIWLSPKHRLASASKIRLHDVAEDPYLLLTTDNNTDTTLRYWAKYKLKPKIGLRTISIEAIRNLVAREAGITILSDLVYRPWSLEGQRIEARSLSENVPDLEIGMAYSKKRPLHSAATTFRNFLKQEIGLSDGNIG